ncbi:MAG: hypothetical protein EOO76_13005 [Novosphingobium sp.]|nr:MAG: hypothetical protein EOO76_13005 [Novosphingobium sp.]
MKSSAGKSAIAAIVCFLGALICFKFSKIWMPFYQPKLEHSTGGNPTQSVPLHPMPQNSAHAGGDVPATELQVFVVGLGIGMLVCSLFLLVRSIKKL